MEVERDPWRALAVVIVGYFMVVLDVTVVAVANPAISTSLHADISQVVWATSAYLLAFATLLLPAGRLGDRFGPKNVYLAGLAVFTIASMACGLADSIGALIAARAVQGVGAALVTPQTMAVITRTFPRERRTAAMSLWGAVAGLANLVGPLLGGVLVDGPGWQWIFLVNVPVGIIGFVLAVRYVPVLATHATGFDIPGVVLSAVGILLLVYGIQEGGNQDWATWIWLTIIGGLTVLAAFLGHQSRSAGEPLLPLSMFRDRNFTLAHLAVAAVGGAVAALLVPLYFYLEQVRGLSGTRAGVVVAPMAVLAMVFVPIVGKFGDRVHPRVIPAAGFALFAVTLGGFALLMTPDSPINLFLVGAAIIGVANACIWPTLAATATHNLPVHQAGAGAGSYNAIRQVGTVLGTAAIGALIASRLSAHGLPADIVADEGAVTGTLPAPIEDAFSSALGESMNLPVALLVCGLIASSLFIRAGKDAPATAQDPPAPQQTAGSQSEVGGRARAEPAKG